MYNIVSATCFTLLALIWRKDDPLNLLCKAGLLGMAVWGFVVRFG